MKRFHVTTFGCQMNEHDSERMKGMLDSLGYAESEDREGADLILFNTCSIRESADNRFIAHLGEAKRLKSEDPARVVGVGGCWAQSVKEEVIRAHAELPSVCEHIHLPLQSGSSRILKAMRRTYDRDRYVKLVATLRDAIPALALGTDVIVGFPGETEADFRETLAVVEEVRYDSAFTFIYSPRAGTEAASMPDQVPDEVKHERLERLVDVVQRIAAERNAARVGSVEEVLVEGSSRTDATLLRGRTRGNVTVNFAGSAEPGDLVDVEIESATSTTLRGAQRTAVVV